MHNCPVCGYNRLRKPPTDHVICPSCGTQFGYSDAGSRDIADIHASLRRGWITRGAKWHSKVVPEPASWNPWLQLINAKLSADIDWLQDIIQNETTTSFKPVPSNSVSWQFAYV